MNRVTVDPLVLLLVAIFILWQPEHALADACHWVDRHGYHLVEDITKVPLEYRRELPMVRNRTALPFTEDEDRDGAMYVWFILGEGGVSFPYLPAREYPGSQLFRAVERPRQGDVAWFAGMVGIRGEQGEILTAKGGKSVAEIQSRHGKIRWYRYSGPVAVRSTAKAERAPAAVFKKVDAALAALDPVAVTPPKITENERRSLQNGWQRTMDLLLNIRKKYPEDPRLLWRVGEAYRLGHNLDVPGAWDRAEAYLLRAQRLAPQMPEPYITLGAHYADTDFEYGARAEAQFRQALSHARKDLLPQIWWGLAISLYYQGKTAEAISTIDRLLAMRPQDASARRLRETFVTAEQGKQPVSLPAEPMEDDPQRETTR